MPRRVYKRKRRKYAKRIGEPIPAQKSLKDLMDELEGERLRHGITCDRLAIQMLRVMGFVR